jgi:glycosyltransferase involved in cell wall biosynthesis
MNQPIFFSIIIPTYNRAPLISATIESILAQTYKHFEVIIVDDGSTDNTEEMVRKFLSTNVLYYKKQNAERAAARNFGTRKAKGVYVNWLDSDDILFPGHLEQAAASIAAFGQPDFFSTGFQYQTEAGQVYYESNYSENVNEDLYKGNPFSIDSVFIRKEIALLYPFNEDRMLSGSEDYELWLRLGARYRIYTSPVITTRFIHHDERSTMVMSNPNRLIERFTKLIGYALADRDVVFLLSDNKGFFEMKNNLILAVDLALHRHLDQSRMYMAKCFHSSPKVILERGFYAFLKYYIKHTLS